MLFRSAQEFEKAASLRDKEKTILAEKRGVCGWVLDMVDVPALLGGMLDLERLLAKVTVGTANPRDVLGLGRSLDRIPQVRAAMGELRTARLDGLLAPTIAFEDVDILIAKAMDTLACKFDQLTMPLDGDDLACDFADDRGSVARPGSDFEHLTSLQTGIASALAAPFGHGLGTAGLQSAVPPAFADPLAPTAAELRRRVIYNNYRALIDPTDLGGMGRLSENCVLNLKNKSHSVNALIDVPEGGASGVIVAQGGAFAGWSLYLHEGRPSYCYNLLGLRRFEVEDQIVQAQDASRCQQVGDPAGGDQEGGEDDRVDDEEEDERRRDRGMACAERLLARRALGIEVDDGPVGLVPDRGDQRDGAGGDRARHDHSSRRDVLAAPARHGGITVDRSGVRAHVDGDEAGDDRELPVVEGHRREGGHEHDPDGGGRETEARRESAQAGQFKLLGMEIAASD